MLPTSDALHDWMNPVVLNNHKIGHLQSEPFEYFIIKDFFIEKVFTEIQNYAGSIDKSLFNRHPNNEYYYTGFNSTHFFRFIFSNNFKLFLKSRTNRHFKHCKSYPIPQLYIFDNARNGIGVHTDFNAGDRRDYGMIFYLHNEWHDNYGGELGFYYAQNLEKASIIIKPEPNTMVAFRISPSSYHGVNKSNIPWTRSTIVVDWDIDN